MIRKLIQYEDFDGNQVQGEYYFHLTKAELIDMELGTEGGLANKLEIIGKSGNGALMIKSFNEIVAAAYGIREGSDKFTKSEEISRSFMGSLAWDALLTELLTDPSAAAEFVNGIVPKDLATGPERIEQMRAELTKNIQPMTEPAGPVHVVREAEIRSLGVGPLPDSESGLKEPRDKGGNLVPWAFREPSDADLIAMTKAQLLDVSRRQARGWKPPPAL